MNKVVVLKDVNRITVCKDRYESQDEFENAVKKIVMSLLDNGYIMTIAYDCDGEETNVVVIDYNYADQAYGDNYPYWLSPNEAENIYKEG